MEELMLIENPYYRSVTHRRKGGKVKSNPTTAMTKNLFQDVGLMEAGAALGGLAAATMVPGLVVKTADTTGQKLLKVIVSLGATAAAGYAFKQVNATAGKMAVAGGLAGTLTQALAMFTNIKIGGQPARVSAPRTMGRIGQTIVPEFEDVRVN